VGPNRTGIGFSVFYLAWGLAWLTLTRPPGLVWLIAWLIAVALVGSVISGPANQVSLARAYLTAPAVAYSISGQLGLLAVVVAIASLSDLVDGTIARRLQRPSAFGGGLDPVVDGLFIGSTTIGLALGGAFPLWLALVVIARYLVPAAAGGVLLALGRRPELRHTTSGQISTTLILILVGGICLFRALKQDSSGLVGAAEVVIPIATLATYIHLAWTLRKPAVAAEPG
jgi:phosphatidylglycerophosphate synthase